MTTNLTLISTVYKIEPVIVCATRFSPSRIILLTEEGAPEEKTRSEKLIEDTFGSVLKVEKRFTSLYDTVQVARDVAAIIEEENAKGQRVMVNVSGGRKPQAFGALFGAYARKEMVDKVVYVTEEDQFVVEFPLLGFGISDTKRLVLEQLEKGETSVSNIAKNLGISKGMAYGHLRELKSLGYVVEDNGFKITGAGRIAII
ncbi:CRISPR locus-related DNA-binding protein [Methanocella conradii HZ254]|uniref:CRISPR locus-related DNA-binding protein n=1 Tax=Methanocella conradii (strain DSM 24694 / JCM 17849 / CGMCC 1.5162 / HZ254) TaxID=1041930 RepID=H8I8N3_METCZ|nr:CRISPR-associated CARF protein Csa3 [Methanocella conradii]AFC99937.1 CRISPR locus-related DNA-binding protein [Methanocella conradii HZ254]MDI6897285.1 CRISPR-associated CARF protein Csa3 [Methanocella conradii]